MTVHQTVTSKRKWLCRRLNWRCMTVSALREENPHLAICVHICENEVACVRVRFCVCLTVWLDSSMVSMCVVWLWLKWSTWQSLLLLAVFGHKLNTWVWRHPQVSDAKLWQSWIMSSLCLCCFLFLLHFSVFIVYDMS